MKRILVFIIGCVFTLTVSAEWPLTENQKREVDELAKETNVPPQMREQYTMIIYVNGTGWFQKYCLPRCCDGQNARRSKLFCRPSNLPTKRPIQTTDIQYPVIINPWFSVFRDKQTMPFEIVSVYGTNIFNASIPREARLRALKFGTMGTLETTNFYFGFDNGKLWEVMRLNEHEVEYYSRDLDKLVGKPSLIDTNGAYQLAMQWLAAVDMDMNGLGQTQVDGQSTPLSANWSYQCGYVATLLCGLRLSTLPCGWPQPKRFDKPLVSVEILGTTKELQDLEITTSLCRIVRCC